MSSGSTARTALCAALLFVPTSVVAQQSDSVALAVRALADTLYWRQRFADARRAYETALALLPDDDGLRLAYGRMLVETLDAARARRVLTPLLGRSQGRAEEWLGTNAYWSGDFTEARRLYRRALRADSSLSTARLNLHEIAAATATALRIGLATARDDQPLSHIGAAVEGEYFVLPLVKVWLHVEMRRYQLGDSLTRVLTIFEDGMSAYFPAARLETEYALGFVRGGYRDFTDTPQSGRLALGFRLPRHTVFRIRAEREQYLYTLASLTTPVTTRTGTASLELKNPRGWLGEAAALRQWYPDTNAVTSAYLWFLAPIAKFSSGDLKAGYSFSFQHANESRFVLANESQPPPRDTSGRYSPYYTPDHLMTHSVLLAATTRLGPSSTLRTNGSFGFRATDRAPVFSEVVAPGPGPNPIARMTYRRTFLPWSARAALDVARSNDWIIAITADYQRTGFYSAGTAGVQLTRRFTRAAIRRVDR